jgi:WD40 repeat protein
VNAVALSADGRHALTGSQDGTARLWDLGDGRELLPSLRHSAPVTEVALSADGHRALTLSQDSAARLWDLGTGRELLRLEGHTASVSAVALSGDGRRALTASWDGTARLWDLETGGCVALFPHDRGIFSGAMSLCPPLIVCLGDVAGNVLIFRIEGAGDC